MKAPSISIIIPAYNTEKYLDKCITSLCRQTYGDFEAIIIDNGSTDQTGSIADRWARTDDRVTVIHTENNGVAEARNTGLRHAHGRYIGFVDSDDRAEPDMFGKLAGAAEAHDADIVICGHYRETEDGDLINTICPSGKTVVWTAHKALVKLLIDFKVKTYLWDKLYKKELFDGVIFPEGHLFEDQRVLPEVFGKASVVCAIKEPLYHYIQRKGSIIGDRKPSTNLDYIDSQLKLFSLVGNSDMFSCLERMVLRSGIAIKLHKALKNTDPLPDEVKASEYYRYHRFFRFFRPFFIMIRKWGRKMM